jgi:ribosome-associated protein YbcJ (S4-like RNA binding protein)
MHPDKRRVQSGDIAVNERDRLRSVARIREDERVELADPRWKACPG